MRRIRPRQAGRAVQRGSLPLGFEACEPRQCMAADAPMHGPIDTHMAVGMNLENVVDWSPAWTFKDAFQASRPWINQSFNPVTWETAWDAADAPPLRLDDRGNVASLATWTNGAGQTLQQRAATLMFRGLGGGYAAGVYRAEWDGNGTVTFGFDAQAVATGRTAAGRNYADLQVTPSDDGIFLGIEATTAADPVRNFNVWMPDWQGQRFAGQRWQPGADFSPFHPLFLERLRPFHTIRFMGMQETNSSDIRSWADRRDASDIRQGSGSGGTSSEPLVNGMALEYMVQLANDLDANPWFNMPHMADDDFVRRFATYVRDHLEPGRQAFVEWSNEIWNFGWGFEASQWVSEQAKLPANAGLDHWQVAGREAKRDLDIWSDVFTGQTDRLVRVAAGWAAVDWVTNRVVESMDGAFDAIAIAPYITITDEQRAGYTAATTVDTVIADARADIATSVAWVDNHARLAREWQTRLGRPIRLVAYEGGPHLDGRGEPYQSAFYAAGTDPRMGGVYRDYLRALDAAGLSLYMDFQLTGQPNATPWGDFAKLHRMDEPLATAHRYAAVAAAADGSLWSAPPPSPTPPPVSVSVVDGSASEAGRDPAVIRFTRGGATAGPLTLFYTVAGTATSGADYAALAGSVTFAAGSTVADVLIQPLDDTLVEPSETISVTLLPRPAYSVTGANTAAVSLASDDRPLPVVGVSSAMITEGHAGRRVMLFSIALSGRSSVPVTVTWATTDETATAGRDYLAAGGRITFAPGQTRRTVGVAVLGDRVVEADETFRIGLMSPVNATLSATASRGLGTIRNDDSLGRVAAAFAALGEAPSASRRGTIRR